MRRSMPQDSCDKPTIACFRADRRLHLGCNPVTLPAIGSGPALRPGNALGPVFGKPPTQYSFRESDLPGDPRKRHAEIEMRPDRREADGGRLRGKAGPRHRHGHAVLAPLRKQRLWR